ncbi:unnamed protein product, partial [Ilex paraguariensis]
VSSPHNSPFPLARQSNSRANPLVEVQLSSCTSSLCFHESRSREKFGRSTIIMIDPNVATQHASDQVVDGSSLVNHVFQCNGISSSTSIPIP